MQPLVSRHTTPTPTRPLHSTLSSRISPGNNLFTPRPLSASQLHTSALTLRKTLAAMKTKSGGDTEFKAGSKRKAAGAAGDKPKRGLTPFFAFLAEFRPQYMEKHPEAKGVAAVTKAAGAEWRAMTDEEKAKYGGKKSDATESKAESKKKESTSSKKAKTDGDEEEAEGSDKSKSDVEDDDDEQDGANEEDE